LSQDLLTDPFCRQNEYHPLAWTEKEVIPTCGELGLGFVPMSPLGVQFLTNWIDANTLFAPGDIRAVESRFSPRIFPTTCNLLSY
jgi:aryl-alcohol dehydrogenase-like predicted oxidoreductase